MGLVVAVFAAGGAGALTRFVVDGAVTRRWGTRFPMGTFVLNVSGSLFLGLVTGFATAHASASARDFAAIVGTGFVGAYTTFSTEEWQTLALLRSGAGMEGLNLVGGLVASLICAGIGLWLGGRL
jgi:CrcB protein